MSTCNGTQFVWWSAGEPELQNLKGNSAEHNYHFLIKFALALQWREHFQKVGFLKLLFPVGAHSKMNPARWYVISMVSPLLVIHEPLNVQAVKSPLSLVGIEAKLCCPAHVTNECEHSKDGLDEEALSVFISFRSHERRLSVSRESKQKTSVRKLQRAVLCFDEASNTAKFHDTN